MGQRTRATRTVLIGFEPPKDEKAKGEERIRKTALTHNVAVGAAKVECLFEAVKRMARLPVASVQLAEVGEEGDLVVSVAHFEAEVDGPLVAGQCRKEVAPHLVNLGHLARPVRDAAVLSPLQVAR